MGMAVQSRLDAAGASPVPVYPLSLAAFLFALYLPGTLRLHRDCCERGWQNGPLNKTVYGGCCAGQAL